MTVITKTISESVQDTERLAAVLATIAQPGDVIALSGALGAGKTTFARGFVRALTGTNEDVPSPTFTLVQTYDTPKGEVWHCDLYRLVKPDDSIELGLEDAFASSICLVEWPERLGHFMPTSRLALSFTFEGTARHITIDGDTRWQARLNQHVSRLGAA